MNIPELKKQHDILTLARPEASVRMVVVTDDPFLRFSEDIKVKTAVGTRRVSLDRVLYTPHDVEIVLDQIKQLESNP